MTLQQLKEKYRDAIMNAMRDFIQKEEREQDSKKEVIFSPEKYEEFRKENELLQYTDYSDMVALMKIEDETHSQPDRNKSRTEAKYMKITNHLLVRKLANDFCSNDIELYFNHYHEEDIEKRNDRVYQFLERLDYNGKADPHIPKLAEGNFKLYQQKRNDVLYTRTLIEIEERMKYLLKYLSMKPHSSSTISYDGLHYLMKEKSIDAIVQELHGRGACFEDVVQKRMREKVLLYDEENVKKSKHRELDVYNQRQLLCEELATHPSKEVNMDTYQQLDENWFDVTKHDAAPSVKSGFQEYKDIKGLQYVRAKMYQRMQTLSEKILHSKRLKNYFQYSYKEEDAYDALLSEMVLLDSIKKENERPTPEFALIDSTKKVIKAVWHFSEKVADVTFDGVDKVTSATKRGIENYKLKRPAPNAVIYVGPYVLVERVEPKKESGTKKRVDKIESKDEEYER